MTISGFIAYVIQTWKNKPDTSTPLSAARLAHIEAGIKANSDAIAKIAAAVINQQANDVNKIPSSALMYSVNDKVDSVISDFTEYCKRYITDNANLNTLGDGVYYYNGWGSSTMSGTSPFSNDYGVWIRRTPYGSIDSTCTDIVIRNNGAIYSRKLISEGTWGPWIISDLGALKSTDFVITKNTSSVALQVNANTYTKITKNAISGAADYGTSIIDYTGGVQTELKIQNGKMWLDGKEIATK
ncbi:hypothetical protein [Hungatella hathewayi]